MTLVWNQIAHHLDTLSFESLGYRRGTSRVRKLLRGGLILQLVIATDRSVDCLAMKEPPCTGAVRPLMFPVSATARMMQGGGNSKTRAPRTSCELMVNNSCRLSETKTTKKRCLSKIQAVAAWSPRSGG